MSPYENLNWQRSSLSGRHCDPEKQCCLEVAEFGTDLIAIRESDYPADIITTTRQKWAVFIEGIKRNEFDHFAEPKAVAS